jgi:hypothetical protein
MCSRTATPPLDVLRSKRFITGSRRLSFLGVLVWQFPGEGEGDQGQEGGTEETGFE